MKKFLKKIITLAVLAMFFLYFVAVILWYKVGFKLGKESYRGKEVPFIMVGLVGDWKDLEVVWKA